MNTTKKQFQVLPLGKLTEPSKERGDPLDLPDTPYVGLEHITKETGQLLEKATAADVRSTKSIFRKGDLLYGKLRPYLNKLWLAEFDGLCSTDILVYPQNDRIDNKFLKYRMMSRDFVRYANSNASGVNLPRVNAKVIGRFLIEHPPLPEQRRIVSKIEELFSKLDAGVAALKQAKAQLQRYRQSVLAAAVTGELTKEWRANNPNTEPASKLLLRIENTRNKFYSDNTNNPEVRRHVSKHKKSTSKNSENWETPSSWEFTSLLKCSKLVVDCHNKTAPYVDSGIPLVRTTNIRDGKLVWNKMKFVDEDTAAFWSKRCIPEPQDILFTREAPAGEATIIPPKTRLCMGQRMMLIRVFPELLLPSFLLTTIQSQKFQNQFLRKQVGVGVQHLRVSDVEALSIPIPPIEEQHQIVAEVEARVSTIDHIETELDQQLIRANRLRQSILSSAFSGKL